LFAISHFPKAEGADTVMGWINVQSDLAVQVQSSLKVATQVAKVIKKA